MVYQRYFYINSSEKDLFSFVLQGIYIIEKEELVPNSYYNQKFLFGFLKNHGKYSLILVKYNYTKFQYIVNSTLQKYIRDNINYINNEIKDCETLKEVNEILHLHLDFFHL